MTTESGTLIPAPGNHRCTRKVPGAGGSPQALPLQTRSTRAAVMPESRLQSSAGMGPQRGSRSPLWRAVSQAGKFKRLTPQDRNVFQAPTSWHTSAAGQDGGDWWVISVNPAVQLHALPVSSSASPGPAQSRPSPAASGCPLFTFAQMKVSLSLWRKEKPKSLARSSAQMPQKGFLPGSPYFVLKVQGFRSQDPTPLRPVDFPG